MYIMCIKNRKKIEKALAGIHKSGNPYRDR